MDTQNPPSDPFRFILTGEVGGRRICAPFMTENELHGYLESMVWVNRKHGIPMELFVLKVEDNTEYTALVRK